MPTSCSHPHFTVMMQPQASCANSVCQSALTTCSSLPWCDATAVTRRTVIYAGFDPLFWLHHCMVDRVLWLFQNNGGQWMGASECYTASQYKALPGITYIHVTTVAIVAVALTAVANLSALCATALGHNQSAMVPSARVGRLEALGLHQHCYRRRPGAQSVGSAT